MSAKQIKVERLRRRADRLATKIVLEVAAVVQNDGTLDAADANKAATLVREMVIKFFNSARGDGLRHTPRWRSVMSYDLEHREIYKLIEAPVLVDGVVVIGGRTTSVSKTDGEDGFSVCVNTKESALDPEHTEVVRVTLPMLAAMR